MVWLRCGPGCGRMVLEVVLLFVCDFQNIVPTFMVFMVFLVTKEGSGEDIYDVVGSVLLTALDRGRGRNIHSSQSDRFPHDAVRRFRAKRTHRSWRNVEGCLAWTHWRRSYDRYEEEPRCPIQDKERLTVVFTRCIVQLSGSRGSVRVHGQLVSRIVDPL